MMRIACQIAGCMVVIAWGAVAFLAGREVLAWLGTGLADHAAAAAVALAVLVTGRWLAVFATMWVSRRGKRHA